MADADYNDDNDEQLQRVIQESLRRPPQAAAAAAAAAPVNKDELTASIKKITREVNESITSKYKLVLPESVREIFEKYVKVNDTEKALKLTKQYILDMFHERQPQIPLPEDEHPDTAALLASPQNPPPPPPQAAAAAAAAVNPDNVNEVDEVVKILTQMFAKKREGGKKSRMSKSRRGKKSKMTKSRKGKKSKMTKSRRGKKSKMTRKKV